jgi:long-chain acyl-CoA synthetase
MQDNSARAPIAEQPPLWAASYAPGVDWRFEVENIPLHALLERSAAKYGDRPAIVFGGVEYSYADIALLVRRAAAGLQARGIGRGVKVGLFMPNSGYSIVMYYAILRAGGTVVNYNPVYTEADLVKQVEDSETDMLVTLDAPPLLEKAAALLLKSRIKQIVVCGARDNMLSPERNDAVAHGVAYCWFADIVGHEDEPAAVKIDPASDIAVLQYTGGTTGVPKGAALTHRNLVANATQMEQWFHDAVPGEDSIVAVLPFFHVFAMTVVMNMPIAKGMKIHVLPQFNLGEMLDLIATQRPACLAAVPTMYTAMVNADKTGSVDFSSLKFCISGGAPLPAEVKSAFEQRTKAKLVAEGYGLTESSPVVTINPISEKARAGSIGLPLPGTTVEIVSLEDGEALMPAGEKGEVCVRGPQVMPGYYKRSEETAQILKGRRLHTGDVGYMDAEGFVYLVDRVKDLILVGGYNVYPRNIEEAIYTHPAVAECIVAGVPDRMRGEAVWAWVKAKDGQALSESDLRSYLQGRLSPIEMPKKVIVREEPLPKTAVGKLSKRDLLEQEGIRK